jgi:hypothetical protein
MHWGAVEDTLSGPSPVELVVSSSFQLAFGGALRLGRELNMASSFPSAAFGTSVSLVGQEETSPFAVESVELFVGSVAVAAAREDKGNETTPRPLTILSLSGAAVQEYDEGEGEGMGDDLEGADMDSGDGDVSQPPPPATALAILSAEDKVSVNHIYILSEAPSLATIDGIEHWEQVNPSKVVHPEGKKETHPTDVEDSVAKTGMGKEELHAQGVDAVLLSLIGTAEARRNPLTRRGKNIV